MSVVVANGACLSEAPLVTNQFEYHPYLGQSYLIAQTRRAGLAVTGYCGMDPPGLAPLWDPTDRG